MFRKFGVIALAIALSACGGEEDFKTSFDRSQGDVFASLATIDARPEIGFISSASSIQHSRPSEDTIQFTLLSPDQSEQAVYAFRIEKIDDRNSVVHTTVDVPSVPIKIGNQQMYVSEWKLEMALRKAMKGLAKDMSSGSSASRKVDGIGELIGMTAVLLDPAKVQQASALASDMTAASEELERQAQWNADNQSDWASGDAAMDRAYASDVGGIDVASSDAGGNSASGYDPGGYDPEPDSDFGSPSDDW